MRDLITDIMAKNPEKLEDGDTLELGNVTIQRHGDLAKVSGLITVDFQSKELDLIKDLFPPLAQMVEICRGSKVVGEFHVKTNNEVLKGTTFAMGLGDSAELRFNWTLDVSKIETPVL